MIIGIDEVKGQGPLNWTAATSWWSTYQTGPVTTNTSLIALFVLDQSYEMIIMCVPDEGS